ncbi:uncharacterized protein LOC129921465 isoform X1 [Episyrphus balteatus]|uniref:uncharacterized protein LOC129921465 isoform X1 n=1 Tax=Episyrphus balteatus TaxID=286459 RepID=UPI002484F39C|nr:uncharacterized protein LOC129921465 isoform X1 [Episyrphus balteatus]
MIKLFLVYALAVGSISAAPQFVDFSNGGIGVNFGGYSARAGLGGLLTGNAADGGLSASAGTPNGQRAAAGIGGFVNGGAAGGAYAGAQANDAVGASAVLGGSTGPNQSGFLGAEAHNNGNSVTRTLIKDSPAQLIPTDIEKVTTVQKVKPPKKYVPQPSITSPIEQNQGTTVVVDVVKVPAVTVVKTRNRRIKHTRPAARRVGLFKTISFAPLITKRFGGDEPQLNVPQTSFKTVQSTDYPVVTKEVTYNPIQFLNIPIGILRSIQESLQPIGYSKQVQIQG